MWKEGSREQYVLWLKVLLNEVIGTSHKASFRVFAGPDVKSGRGGEVVIGSYSAHKKGLRVSINFSACQIVN